LHFGFLMDLHHFHCFLSCFLSCCLSSSWQVVLTASSRAWAMTPSW
jgi:hypothetical protein